MYIIIYIRIFLMLMVEVVIFQMHLTIEMIKIDIQLNMLKNQYIHDTLQLTDCKNRIYEIGSE